MQVPRGPARCVNRRLAHLNDLVRLILVRDSRKQPPPLRRRRHDQLGENAARTPHVNCAAVLLLAQQNLGRSVPASDHVFRERSVLCLASSQAEVTNAHVAILAHQAAAGVSSKSKQCFASSSSHVGRLQVSMDNAGGMQVPAGRVKRAHTRRQSAAAGRLTASRTALEPECTAARKLVSVRRWQRAASASLARLNVLARQHLRAGVDEPREIGGEVRHAHEQVLRSSSGARAPRRRNVG